MFSRKAGGRLFHTAVPLYARLIYLGLFVTTVVYDAVLFRRTVLVTVYKSGYFTFVCFALELSFLPAVDFIAL